MASLTREVGLSSRFRRGEGPVRSSYGALMEWYRPGEGSSTIRVKAREQEVFAKFPLLLQPLDQTRAVRLASTIHGLCADPVVVPAIDPPTLVQPYHTSQQQHALLHPRRRRAPRRPCLRRTPARRPPPPFRLRHLHLQLRRGSTHRSRSRPLRRLGGCHRHHPRPYHLHPGTDVPPMGHGHVIGTRRGAGRVV